MRPHSLAHDVVERIAILNRDAARVCAAVDFSSLENKEVLVTGASGLLGIQFLATLGHLILEKKRSIPVSILVFSEPDPVLQYYIESCKIRCFRGNIGDADFLKSLPEFDAIIHAAGYGQPGKFTADPVSTLSSNFVGTLGLLKRLRRSGRFLFTSSAEVYTGLSSPPFREEQIGTTNTDHPRSSYIEGKRSAEALCYGFRKDGVDAKSVRISLTYGPGAKSGDTRVLNSFIDKALAGAIHLVDAGAALRSFLYVSDAVTMMWKILLEGKQGVYNVGGVEECSILSLAQKIGAQIGVPVLPAEDQPGLSGAPAVVRLAMDRFHCEFESFPLVSLEEGLEWTILWHRELNKSL